VNYLQTTAAVDEILRVTDPASDEAQASVTELVTKCCGEDAETVLMMLGVRDEH
jgi:hypothetical protein